MISILFIIQIVLAILITILVLLQKSSGGGLVNYSGSNESVFGAKGANGFLVKTTFVFGAFFLINTVALSYLYIKGTQKTIMTEIQSPVTSPIQAPSAPSAPSIPTQKVK